MRDKTEPVHVRVTLRAGRPYKVAKRTLLDAFEESYVATLMERHGNNLSAASRESGLSRRHLRTLLRKYDLYHPVEHGEAAPPDGEVASPLVVIGSEVPA
jgi:DNA-binding NtrC family response regulator